MEFKEMKILEFIEDLSGDKSSPGGGSTAALVSALPSSLNDMVYSFTVDKKSFENLTEENKAEMLKLQSDTKEFTKNALAFMEKDRADFMAVMECYKLPNNTEEEKKFRKEKPLTLILDHINGHNHDNRLENLRWVCPNCNQQLDTTNGRNVKKLKEQI